jgi:hypothetical protein
VILSTIQENWRVVVLKKVGTVSYEDAKLLLRRRDGGALCNQGGWCVYVNKQGRSYYVVDDVDARPIAFQRIRFTASHRLPSMIATASSRS